MKLLKSIKDDGLIVIIRNISDEDLIEVAESAYRGGARVFEVSLNQEQSYQQIKKLKEYFTNKDVLIGAGTVTNKEKAIKSHQLNADFFLTPGICKEVLDYSKEFKIPIIPGVFSPSEFQYCIENELKLLKLFPANSVKMNYIKNLRGPYNDFDVMAVGGVTEENLDEFLEAGHIGVGMGSSLLKKDDIKEKKWINIEERVKRVKEKIILYNKRK